MRLFEFRCLTECFCNLINYYLSCFKEENVTLLEKYSDLCDLFKETFKTGNWGVTHDIEYPYIEDSSHHLLPPSLYLVNCQCWV